MNFDKLNKYGLCVFPYWRKVESGVMFQPVKVNHYQVGVAKEEATPKLMEKIVTLTKSSSKNA